MRSDTHPINGALVQRELRAGFSFEWILLRQLCANEGMRTRTHVHICVCMLVRLVCPISKQSKCDAIWSVVNKRVGVIVFYSYAYRLIDACLCTQTVRCSKDRSTIHTVFWLPGFACVFAHEIQFVVVVWCPVQLVNTNIIIVIRDVRRYSLGAHSNIAEVITEWKPHCYVVWSFVSDKWAWIPWAQFCVLPVTSLICQWIHLSFHLSDVPLHLFRVRAWKR